MIRDISIVIPIYNEQDNIIKLIKEVRTSLEKKTKNIEEYVRLPTPVCIPAAAKCWPSKHESESPTP